MWRLAAGFGLLSLLALLVILGSPVQAEVTGSIEGPGPELVPGEPEPMTVRIDVDCQTALTSLQAPMRFTLEAKVPPEINATGPATLDVDPTECSNGNATVSGLATYQVTASRSATPEQLWTIQVTAIGQGPPTSAPPVLQLKSPPSRVQLLIDIETATPVQEAEAGPQKQILFPIVVKNHGNGRVLVTFEVVSDDPEWRAIAPPPIVLDAVGGMTEDTANFLVSTPYQNGPNDNEASFVVRVSTSSTMNYTFVGPSVDLTFHAQSSGLYVPAPGLMPVALVLAAAGLILRRRSPA